jgi:hypothetical protein
MQTRAPVYGRLLRESPLGTFSDKGTYTLVKSALKKIPIEWHYKIIHNRIHDLIEGSTNDNTDSKINYISPDGKLFEFFHESHNSLFFSLKD